MPPKKKMPPTKAPPNEKKWAWTEIIGHKQNGSSYDLHILWETGEKTWEPMDEFLPQAKENGWLYAKFHKLPVEFTDDQNVKYAKMLKLVPSSCYINNSYAEVDITRRAKNLEEAKVTTLERKKAVLEKGKAQLQVEVKRLEKESKDWMAKSVALEEEKAQLQVEVKRLEKESKDRMAKSVALEEEKAQLQVKLQRLKFEP